MPYALQGFSDALVSYCESRDVLADPQTLARPIQIGIYDLEKLALHKQSRNNP